MITPHFDKAFVAWVMALSDPGHGNKGPHLHSRVNGHEVAQLPAEQSLHQTVQVRQQQQEQAQALAQQQAQDPNTPKGPKLT